MNAEPTSFQKSRTAFEKRPVVQHRNLALLFALLVPHGGSLAQNARVDAVKPVAAENRPWLSRSSLSDPLRTEPPALNRSLRVHLPPDLLESTELNPARGSAAGVDALMPIELRCASRASAERADNPQWALQTLRASSPGPIPELTLPVAIQLAICHNPQLRASWSQIAQQAAQVGQAKSAYWPQLNAGVGRQSSDVSYGNNFPGTSTQATTQNVILSWRLWDFGARDARTDAAQAQLNAALSGQNATLQKLLGEVLYLYADAQAAEARLFTQKQLLPLADRNLLAAQRRQAGGAGSSGDTLQAVTAQARIRLEQSRAEGELSKSHAQLGYQLGLPSGVAYTLPPLLPSLAKEKLSPSPTVTDRLMAKALDDWLGYARENHPAIASARAQFKAAEAGVSATESDGLPTVDLNLGHYRNGRPTQALSSVRSRENVVGVSVSIPLFDGYANAYKVRAARATVEQKRIELQATEQQTLQDLVQQHAEAHATLKNLRAAIDLHSAASAAAQSAQRQYENHTFDILQLNQSLITLQQAQHDMVRSQLEWNRARLKLWLAEMPI
ncbi:TolC family protein [Comamonas guangdongensis]|uniref:TolC family protein n=1 Tax=Comamonas guangdongensis TaxID=510515 RepID=A0ABV4A0M5_9BURK